jgi:hypothetical protein
VTSSAIIQEIKHLPPSEQAHQLTPKELGELANRLATSNDPAEIIRLKSAMTRGFYGE